MPRFHETPAGEPDFAGNNVTDKAALDLVAGAEAAHGLAIPAMAPGSPDRLMTLAEFRGWLVANMAAAGFMAVQYTAERPTSNTDYTMFAADPLDPQPEEEPELAIFFGPIETGLFRKGTGWNLSLAHKP